MSSAPGVLHPSGALFAATGGCMKWRDLSDPGSPIRREFGYDEVEHTAIIRAIQPNINECLELNQAMYNLECQNSTSLFNGRSMVLVARTPLWLIEKWKNEEGLDFFNRDHQPGLIARWNSNEYSALRVSPGML